MTEAEWQACTDPGKMLDFLRGKASDRKLRLFGCATCRRVWDHLRDRDRRPVEASERFADDSVSSEEFRAALREPGSEVEQWNAKDAYMYWCPVGALLSEQPERAWERMRPIPMDPDGPWPQLLDVLTEHRPGDRARYDAIHAELLREIVAHPFRTAAIDPAWLAWNGGTAARLAQGAYEERRLPSGLLDNARLAVLADALEEAGCSDCQILGHLRSGGEHVRGCFVVDALLGKS
jgi:hypothetical protein